MTRRALIVGTVAAQLVAQTTLAERELATDNSDTFLSVVDAEGNPTGTQKHVGPFMVGVRTRVKADQALVEVFYHAFIDGIKGAVLLSKASLAPVAGFEAYGGTRDNFDIPRERVQFIRVRFFNEVGKREAKIA